MNGESGVAFTFGDAVIQVVTPHIEGGVRAVSMTNDPDEPSRWSVAKVEQVPSFQSPRGGRQPGDST